MFLLLFFEKEIIFSIDHSVDLALSFVIQLIELCSVD